jgi:hypothetical protein
MTIKTFYLLTLLAVTTLGVINLLMVRFQIKKDNNITNLNLVKSIDFITLAVSSWLMVAFYKLFDIDEFSLKFITNDRFLSALSNLFLLLSLPHLPDNNSLIKKYFKTKNNYKVSFTMFFIIVIVIYSITDRFMSDYNFIAKSIIIYSDALISIATVFIFAKVLLSSYKTFQIQMTFPWFFKLICGLMIITQIFFPLLKLYTEELRPFYYYFLAIFIGVLAFFIQHISFYIQFFQWQTVDKKTILQLSDNQKEDDVFISKFEKLLLKYNKSKNSIYWELNFMSEDNKHFTEQLTVNKPSSIILHLFLFMAAKKQDKWLPNSEFSLQKFRLVDLWNKTISFKLKSDLFYTNIGNSFQLNLTIKQIEHNIDEGFLNTPALKNLFHSHVEYFIEFESSKKIKLKKDFYTKFLKEQPFYYIDFFENNQNK